MKHIMRNSLLIFLLWAWLSSSIVAASNETKKSADAKSDVKKAKVVKSESDKSAVKKPAAKKQKSEKKASHKKAKKKKPAEKAKKQAEAKAKAKKSAAAKSKKSPPTFTVKRKPLKIQFELDGYFESAEMCEIELRPEEWSAFIVEEAVEHGSRVKRGDVLVKFDPEKID
ncbi:MAG: hypothetical protein ACWGMZ_06415, partial [Thermoguttaceae bacterium]